jgi:ubiquinone/menaquinone biosynthesis C-methylase UbiE
VSYVELFSGHAEQYAAARPHYPAALFEWLAAAAPRRELAWDCATGSGQAAQGLVRHFARVTATDASAAQLAHAEPHPRITYRHASCEASGLEPASADAITVAQALHWLDLPAFFEEALRVLAPGGIFAAWTYSIPRVTPAIDAAVDRLYRETLAGYWAERRLLVDEGYRSITLPFEEVEAPLFEMTMEWTLEQFAAYVRTWSAVQRFIADRSRDPVAELAYTLGPYWGQPYERRTIRWTVSVRAGRSY